MFCENRDGGCAGTARDGGLRFIGFSLLSSYLVVVVVWAGKVESHGRTAVEAGFEGAEF